MADPLYDLLVPYLDLQDANADARTTAAYLARLTTLPLEALTSSEQQSLAQTAHSALRSLQALAKRSHKPIIAAADRLLHLRHTLPHLAHHARAVQADLPHLDTAAQRFAEKYSNAADNAILDRRRKSMLLSTNLDRLADLLDLPTLLSSAISSSTAAAQAPASSLATNANYASALDLYAHIKRLHTLYPDSPLVSSLAAQAEHEMKTMTTNLIASLHSPGIKLAGAMRTIGWLRRVAPDLDESWSTKPTAMGSGEGTLGAVFLVCRLACLESMLAALDPLRDLADHETEQRLAAHTKPDGAWSAGQHTDKYLKKYLEVFREQSFAVISMYKSIFPSALPAPAQDDDAQRASDAIHSVSSNLLQPIPSALATFPLYLVEMLFDTLRHHLPNVQDRSARDSLLTQVLYCAASLGRLGADFSMMIALLEQDLHADLHDQDALHPDQDLHHQHALHSDQEDTEQEWIHVMKKHRVQASRLELLASGVGARASTLKS